jgi:hypothetical protein
MTEKFIATIQSNNGETFEYGLIIEKQSAIYSGKLSVIITKGDHSDDLAEPTIVINTKELAAGPLYADSVDGVKELTAAFIESKHHQDIHWKDEQF